MATIMLIYYCFQRRYGPQYVHYSDAVTCSAEITRKLSDILVSMSVQLRYYRQCSFICNYVIIEGLTTEFQGVTEGLTTEFQGFTEGLTTEFQGFTEGLTTEFQGFTEGLTTEFQGFTEGLTTEFQGFTV